MRHAYEMIRDQRSLERWCERWRERGRFCFDTEFIRDETFEAALCLIQVSDGERIVLIDPLADVDVDAFWGLLADPRVVKVVHAGKEDFEVCIRQTGRLPRNIFDVQIAAGFVGYGYPLSLSRLVQAVLHRRITKAQTLTDWARRPLTDSQLQYAAEDVAHLPMLHRRLAAALDERGRTEWAAEEFRAFEDKSLYRPPVRERLLRLKGAKRLDAQSLAVLERLVQWRERRATARNRPTRAIIRDDILVQIAKRKPTRATDLEVLRGFPLARNRAVVREILAEIEAARRLPPESWPQPYRAREETPGERIVLGMLTACMQSVCQEQEIAPDLVGNTQRFRELLDYLSGRTAEQPLLLRGWREQFIGQHLVDLLQGHSELYLSGWPDNPRLRVMRRPH